MTLQSSGTRNARVRTGTPAGRFVSESTTLGWVRSRRTYVRSCLWLRMTDITGFRVCAHHVRISRALSLRGTVRLGFLTGAVDRTKRKAQNSAREHQKSSPRRGPAQED